MKTKHTTSKFYQSIVNSEFLNVFVNDTHPQQTDRKMYMLSPVEQQIKLEWPNYSWNPREVHHQLSEPVS